MSVLYTDARRHKELWERRIRRPIFLTYRGWGNLGRLLPEPKVPTAPIREEPQPRTIGYGEDVINTTPPPHRQQRPKTPDWLWYLAWFACAVIAVGAAILCYGLWPRG